MQYQRPGKHDTLKQCGPASQTVAQHWFNVPCLLGRDLVT